MNVSSLVAIVRGFFLIALFALSLGALHAEPEFTAWMSQSELNAYLEKLDGDKPEDKNYWDRGNWITGVEGRWEAGIPQYRINYGRVPESRAHWWFWFVNQDQKAFGEHVQSMADQGFTLVQYNSYVCPGGSERFQGVWQRLVPLTGAAVLPPGSYRLSWIEGKPYTGPLLTLAIEGTKISGHGPACSFKGSVRDRFSGTIDVSRIGEDSSNLTPREREVERSLLKALENANWDEQDGTLRVVQDGRTVLRFEPDTNGAK
jgi:hypothetical protein